VRNRDFTFGLSRSDQTGYIHRPTYRPLLCHNSVILISYARPIDFMKYVISTVKSLSMALRGNAIDSSQNFASFSIDFLCDRLDSGVGV